MKSWLIIVSLVFSGLLAMPAQVYPDNETADSKVMITSMTLPRPQDTSVAATAARRELQQFLRDNPHVEVQPFMMPKIEGAAMDSGILMGIAAGQAPQIMYVNFRQSSSYINHGFLAPMDELLARLESDNPRVREADEDGNWLEDPTPEEIARATQMLRERTLDVVWPVVYRKPDTEIPGVRDKAHVWAMPYQTLVKALLYRRDVFLEAGLNPDEPPRDWDELLEYSRKIAALPNKTGLIIGGGVNVSYSVYNFMVSNGVRYMKQNEDGEWVAGFNTPEAAEAIYYLLQLSFEPYEVDGETFSGAALAGAMGTSDANRRWDNGEVGMNMVYIEAELLTNINPAQVGIAPSPGPPGKNPSGEVNARMMGIFADSTPQQKLAAMRYIWFISGEQAEQLRVRVMVNHGYGQFVNPILLEKYGYNDILRAVPESWRTVFERAVESGVPEPYGKNTQFIYNRVSEPINWAFERENAETLLAIDKAEALSLIREQLDDAAERVNKHMLGRLSEDEWAQRRMVGGIALVLIVIIFSSSMFIVWRSFTRAEAAVGDRPPIHRFVKAYAMLSPALIVVILWQYGPVIMGLPLALFDYQLVAETRFMGIDNFATVLYDERFWASLGRTFYYSILVVGLGFWPPILVAILLDEVPTSVGKYFFRTIFYLPTIVSGVIMVFLWVQLYKPNEDGFLNQIVMSINVLGPVSGTLVKWLLLGAWLSLIGLLIAMVFHLRELGINMRIVLAIFALSLLGVTIWPLIDAYLPLSDMAIRQLEHEGINPATRTGWAGVMHVLSQLVGRWNVEPLGWHTDPGMAMLCVVIPGIWAAAGPGCIIYLAALKTVPEELVEASTIDGAGIIQKISYITLPRIKFLILIQLIGAVVSAFKGGTNFILAMTGGGPQTETGGATMVLGMDIFQRTFMELQYGIGAAMALLLGTLVIGLTAYQLKRMSRAEFKTADTAEQATTNVPPDAPAGNR